MNCPKCGNKMKNCCAEATKGKYLHTCGQSENYCPKCHYREVDKSNWLQTMDGKWIDMSGGSIWF
jgi:hypothetical protein